jgi:hypothetical protein
MLCAILMMPGFDAHHVLALLIILGVSTAVATAAGAAAAAVQVHWSATVAGAGKQVLQVGQTLTGAM